MRRLLSPAFFLLVVVAFFLPFVTVSCSTGAFQEGLGELGETADLGQIPSEIEVSATGYQIVVDDVPEPEGLEGLEEQVGAPASPVEQESFPGRIYAILAAVAAILGIGLSLLGARIGPALALGLGLLGAILLFLLRQAISNEIGPAQAFGFQVTYEYGWWLAVLFFVAAASVGVWRLLTERDVVATAPPGEPVAAPGEPMPPPAEPPPPPVERGTHPATPPPSEPAPPATEPLPPAEEQEPPPRDEERPPPP